MPDIFAAGCDGNLLFTEFSGNPSGRTTPTGVITEFSSGSPREAHPGWEMVGHELAGRVARVAAVDEGRRFAPCGSA
jgi:hypothetical protein